MSLGPHARAFLLPTSLKGYCWCPPNAAAGECHYIINNVSGHGRPAPSYYAPDFVNASPYIT